MLSYREQADAQAPRIGEILAGVVLAIFGLLFAGLAAFATYRFVTRGTAEAGVAVFFGVILLMGVFCGVTAWRLILGRGRKQDGGLFAPWMLRFMGLMLLGNAVLALLLPDVYFAIVATMATMGAGCFYLAHRRQRATEELAPRSDQ